MTHERLASALIAALGATLFTILLVRHAVGEASYIILISILSLSCLVLLGFPRLRLLDLRNLKMTLDRVKEIKTEVFAKEHDLREIALVMAKILAFSNALQGRWGSPELHLLKNQWYRAHTLEMLNVVDISDSQRKEAMKYFDAWGRFDETDKEGSETRELQLQTILKMIQADISDAPPPAAS